METSTLLLSSRFYAYTNGKTPWGLPNHFWSEAPHLLILFDELLFDEEAFKAEELAHSELGWAASGLFVRLKKEGVLSTQRMQRVVLEVPSANPAWSVPDRDNYYAIQVQQRLQQQRGAPVPIFDWERGLARTIRTLAPASPGADLGVKPNQSSRNLKYLWTVIANQSRVVPSLTTLTGEGAEAHNKVRELEAPYWRQLEQLEISQADYIKHLRNFAHLYRKMDSQLEPIAKYNFDRFMKFREETKEQRRSLRPLILGAFDDQRGIKEYSRNVQDELARALPSIFLAVPKVAAKLVIGMALLGASWAAAQFGFHVGEYPQAIGNELGIGKLLSIHEDLRAEKKRRKSANPLRVLVKAAKRHKLA